MHYQSPNIASCKPAEELYFCRQDFDSVWCTFFLVCGQLLANLASDLAFDLAFDCSNLHQLVLHAHAHAVSLDLGLGLNLGLGLMRGLLSNPDYDLLAGAPQPIQLS